MKSSSRLWYLAYAWRSNNWALGRGVCIYTYLGSTPSISELWAPSLSAAGAGGVLSGGGASVGRGAPVSLCLQHVCGVCVLPFLVAWQPSVWCSWTIAGCLSIAAFTFRCPGYSTPHFLSSLTFVQGCVIRRCISSILACKNPPMAIFVIFNARHMMDCSSCTWNPCLAIVVKVRCGYYLNHIRLHSLPISLYSLFRPVSGTHITTFNHEKSRTDNIMMLDFMDCPDECLGRPWRFPMMGSNYLVMSHSTFTRYTLYCKFMALYHGKDTLSSDRMLLGILTASGFIDDCYLCVPSHIFGGCIRRVLLDWDGSALLLRLSRCRIELSTHHSARFGSACSWLRCLWSHDSLLWKRWERWKRKEVGSLEDYIVCFKSKCKEWQPTCTFYSRRILQSIAAGCRDI